MSVVTGVRKLYKCYLAGHQPKLYRCQPGTAMRAIPTSASPSSLRKGRPPKANANTHAGGCTGIQRTFPGERPPSLAKSGEHTRTRSVRAPPAPENLPSSRRHGGAGRRSQDADGAAGATSLEGCDTGAEEGMQSGETGGGDGQLGIRGVKHEQEKADASPMCAEVLSEEAEGDNLQEKAEDEKIKSVPAEDEVAVRERKRALDKVPKKKKKKRPLFTKRRKVEGGVGFLPSVGEEEDGVGIEAKGDTPLTESEAADAGQWMLCEDLTSNCTYTGKIVAYGSKDMVLVHYKGWKTKDREWVPRDRLTPIPPDDCGAQPGKLGRSHWPESSDASKKKGGKGKGKGEEEDTYAEQKIQLEELLEHMCYECGEDGPLVFCKRCFRHFHPDCVGDGCKGAQGSRRTVDASRNPICPIVHNSTHHGKKDCPGTTVGGGAAEGNSSQSSQWTCRLCVKLDKEAVGLPAGGGQGCRGAVPRLLQLCDRFPMKHPYAAFGRQLVRIYELASQLQDAGMDANDVARMLYVQPGTAGQSVAGIVLQRLRAAAQKAGLSLSTSITDGPSAGTVVGALALRQHGGNDNLHCDVCGYNKVEVGCTTCAAVFHLRCLNLWLEQDEDMPSDWRCRICLHEAKERGTLIHDSRPAESPVAADVDGDASGCSSSVGRSAAHRRSSGAAAAKPSGRDKLPRLDGVSAAGPGTEGLAVARAGGSQAAEVTEDLGTPVCGLGVASCELPDEPMLCSSCGFFEQESVRCDSCGRWFCFGCTALSLHTLPAGTFACPECFGIDTYDKQLAANLAVFRAQIAAGEASHLEMDMFVQTVFDLFSTCAWSELGKNLEILIELVGAQIKAGIVPAVAPFHSVHYPMPKDMVRDIATLHSQQALQRALMAEGGHRQTVKELKLWDSERLRLALLPPAQSPQPGVQENPPRGKLRIGYLSADFCNHPTADLMQSALLLHDKTRFDIYLYAITRHDTSQYRQVLKREIPNFRSLPNTKTDKACAQMIADDGIHVLINLNRCLPGCAPEGVLVSSPVWRWLMSLRRVRACETARTQSTQPVHAWQPHGRGAQRHFCIPPCARAGSVPGVSWHTWGHVSRLQRGGHDREPRAAPAPLYGKTHLHAALLSGPQSRLAYTSQYVTSHAPR
jgi:hypothetical protein